MLLNDRRESAIYKVVPQEKDLWAVTIFDSEVDTNTNIYRSDLLPEWMHECIRILDVAGNRVVVQPIGKKVANTYWISSELWVDDVHFVSG